MAVIVPDYFGNAFAQSFAQARHYAEREAERKRQEEAMLQSLTAMSGANEPLPPATTMQPTQVQSPISALPGQSGIGTQASAPVQQPIQTQAETTMLPQSDPYKEGINAIKKQYAEKMKATLPQMKDPRVAAQFIHQATSERDMALAQHNSAMFQNDLMELMQDTSKTPIQKAQAGMLLNSRYKIGMKPNEVMKMFEAEKPTLQFAPDGTAFINGRPASNQGQYGKPDKPTGQLTEYQRYQMQKDKENPTEKTQNIPGFGNITNSQILSLYSASLPKETQREAFNPMTGQKEMMKSVDPGKPETVALLKPFVDKIKGVTNQPSTSATNEPPMDEVIASIQANGEAQTLKLLTEAFGAKKAEELLGRSRAYSK